MDTIGQLNTALTDRYIVEREIGRGGMATVYLARDLKHDRHVALKVLNPELGAVLGVERFLSEIKVTTNLQHPNLLPLFDSGAAEGLLFYVMPFIEGESLRARLDREKQLPVEDAIRLTQSIASALDYAHRHGVIHRDLKPENILLHDGQPVVADFGIALAVSNAGGERVTQTGISLGTPQYMSPEQATGDRTIDGRSDVYSLGAMLYEMLTGDPPYHGSTSQAIIARVLTEKPRSVRLAREAVPAHVDFAIEKALAKVPADRWSTAAQFSDALAGKAGMIPLDSAAATVGKAASPGGQRRDRLAAVGGAVGTVVFAALWWWTAHHPTMAEIVPAARFVVTLPPSAPISDVGGSPLLITPDGRTIVYSSVGSDGIERLSHRAIDQLAVKSYDGTDEANFPFLSSDGKWVAFYAHNELRRVPIEGGPATTIARIPAHFGASWGQSDTIILGALTTGGGLYKLPASGGGTPVEFLAPDTTAGEVTLRWPRLLSDGNTVVYTSWHGTLETAQLGVVSLSKGTHALLGVPGTSPFGVFDGHLVYARPDGALMAGPFDLASRKTTGSPILVLDGVRVGTGGASKAAISANGTLIYSSRSVAYSMLTLVDAKGTLTRFPNLTEPRDYFAPRFSPDGGSIALEIDGQTDDIWIYDVKAATLRRLTTEGNNDGPSWMADGQSVVFASDRGGKGGLWRQSVGAPSPPTMLVAVPFASVVDVARDGKGMYYTLDGGATQSDIWFRPFVGDTTPVAAVSTRFAEDSPAASPDGRWLAFVSDESGRGEVYVQSISGTGVPIPISTGGGSYPRWSPDGQRLYYAGGQRLMFAARVRTTPDFGVIARDTLFDVLQIGIELNRDYDVARDGRLLMLQHPPATPDDIVIVVNWLTEFRDRIRRR